MPRSTSRCFRVLTLANNKALADFALPLMQPLLDAGVVSGGRIESLYLISFSTITPGVCQILAYNPCIVRRRPSVEKHAGVLRIGRDGAPPQCRRLPPSPRGYLCRELILTGSAPHHRAMSADKLKEEGNALFAKKQYGLAALKYTEAIEIDEGNAVLWANRAACRLNTRQ